MRRKRHEEIFLSVAEIKIIRNLIRNLDLTSYGYNKYTLVVNTDFTVEVNRVSTTLSIKVGERFAKAYRNFCEVRCLAVGKFTEHALTEIMEDYHFGLKAQKILSRSTSDAVEHAKLKR